MIMPIAPERDDQESLVRALDVATALNCHLDVVFVRPDPNETYFYTGFTPLERDHVVADMQKHMEQRGRSAAERSRRKFNALCKEAGIEKGNHPDPAGKPTAAWRQV